MVGVTNHVAPAASHVNMWFFQNEFGESKAVTAGIVSLFHAVPLLSGKLARFLLTKI